MVQRSLLALSFLVLILLTSTVSAEDVLELKTGAKPKGKIVSSQGDSITIEIQVGSRTFKRKYSKEKIAAIVVNGKRKTLAEFESASGRSSSNRTPAEVQRLIDTIGKTPPDWYDSTPLNYPKTLDLSWPQPPPTKKWESSKNMGQYIWSRVNENPGKWREGVKLLHHVMLVNKDDRQVLGRSMRALGRMYHNLHQDYARAAFWYQQAGIDKGTSTDYQAGINLANCYFQLGSKSMSLAHMKRMKRRPYSAIKLLGDMGETDEAIRLADTFAKNSSSSRGKTLSYLYGGEACRLAGRLDAAKRYFRKVINVAENAKEKSERLNLDANRAKANLAAIEFLSIKPANVKNGTYTASSLGYEAQVHIEVVVNKGKIVSVKVTKHKEKQFYSSLKDTTRNIVDQQSVQTVDTTSGATITSEAIIRATAQALSTGLN